MRSGGLDSAEYEETSMRSLILTLLASYTSSILQTATTYVVHQGRRVVERNDLGQAMRYHLVDEHGMFHVLAPMITEVSETGTLSETTAQHPVAENAIRQYLPHMEASSRRHGQNRRQQVRDVIELFLQTDSDDDEESETDGGGSEVEDEEDEEEKEESSSSPPPPQQQQECTCNLCTRIREAQVRWSTYEPSGRPQEYFYDLINRVFSLDE
jgi:hypothetical protein